MLKRIIAIVLFMLLSILTLLVRPVSGDENHEILSNNGQIEQSEAYKIYKASQSANAGEIRYLIHLVKQSNFKIIRSGQEYTSLQAAQYLNVKYNSVGTSVTSTEQFIDQFASFTTAGEPVMVIDHHGGKHPARSILYSELRRLRNFEAKAIHQAKL
ncbi:MAG: DUF5329 family protein [Candidatus Omnitrophota bacterium]